MKILSIIKKDFLRFARSRTSGSIILLGPLLLVILLGLTYSSSTKYYVDVGVYSDSYTPLADELVQLLSDNYYNVVRYSSVDACLEGVKRQSTEVCIVFPPSLVIKEGVANTIDFYMDYSKLNLVYLIMDVMGQKVSVKSVEISRSLTEDLLGRLSFTRDRILAEQGGLWLVQNKTADVASRAIRVYDDVSAMQLKFDFDFGVFSQVTSNTATSLDGISTMTTTVDTQLDSIKGKFANIKAYTNGLKTYLPENQSDYESILGTIEESYDLINQTKTSLKDNYNSTKSNLQTLSTMVNDLSSRYDELDKNLKSANIGKADAVANLDSIKTELSEIQGSLQQLKTAFDEILVKVSTIEITNASQIAQPIIPEFHPLNIEESHLNNIFPTLMVLIVMITSVLLASTMTIAEKKSRAAYRNALTPTSHVTFLVSIYIVCMLIVIMQLVVFMLIAWYFFKVSVFANFGVTALILFLTASLFILVGVFIGSFLRTEETTTLAAITVSTIFLFFSNTILPIQSMPLYISRIAQYNPFVIAESLLKQSMFFSFTLAEMQINLAIMAASCVMLALLILAFTKILSEISVMMIHQKGKAP